MMVDAQNIYGTVYVIAETRIKTSHVDVVYKSHKVMAFHGCLDDAEKRVKQLKELNPDADFRFEFRASMAL